MGGGVSSSGNNKKSYLKEQPSVAKSMLRRPKKSLAPPFCELHPLIQMFLDFLPEFRGRNFSPDFISSELNVDMVTTPG